MSGEMNKGSKFQFGIWWTEECESPAPTGSGREEILVLSRLNGYQGKDGPRKTKSFVNRALAKKYYLVINYFAKQGH